MSPLTVAQPTLAHSEPQQHPSIPKNLVPYPPPFLAPPSDVGSLPRGGRGGAVSAGERLKGIGL